MCFRDYYGRFCDGMKCVMFFFFENELFGIVCKYIRLIDMMWYGSVVWLLICFKIVEFDINYIGVLYYKL